ncbi:MAG: radical SAM protein [Desulfobacterales bacterium]|nr:radical SAM protein [Desulfobacterales bacterium]
MDQDKQETYNGFEQGPIRPPSEAKSLLIRITRNCPWNRCKFCPVYKGTEFSIRPVEYIIKDIDLLHRIIIGLNSKIDNSGYISNNDISSVAEKVNPNELDAFYAALNWLSGGMKSIFLQDANSLIIKPKDIIAILKHIKNCFPWVERITSYARSHTIAKISDDDLKMIEDAGLNRIHIGLESGSDKVLSMINKGVTKETHIKAGLKVKKAGIELSEYLMPGLGGVELSEIHAIESADALNQINPDFIRLRTLAIPNSVELFEDYEKGTFKKCSDVMVVNEILLFLENLKGITSSIKSDHILNLFEELKGKLPNDKEKMMTVLKSFLELAPQKQMIYQVGRRLGIMHNLSDIQNSTLSTSAYETCLKLGITPENVDSIIYEIMKKFI